MHGKTFKNLAVTQEMACNHADQMQALQRRFGPLAEQLSKVAEATLGSSRMIDEVLKQNRAIHAALGPIEDLRQQMLDVSAPWQREAERMADLASAYEKKFRLPEISEFTRLSESIANSNVTSALAGYHSHLADVQRAAEAMREPWLDVQDTMRSFGGLAEIQAIGHALKVTPPFDGSVTAALRKDLGDWRGVKSLPEGIFDDPFARVEFYHDLGFNEALTAFPIAAFDQSLDITRLRVPDFLPVILAYDGRPRVELKENEEDHLARNHNAYALLLVFETQLRNFLDKTMTHIFGTKWVKQRVPSKVYQAWEEKQQYAIDKGEQVQPLIAYADFSDYILIIERKDNWREVFLPIFKRQEDIKESFRRLQPIRVCTMHARIITLDDEFLLHIETRRILKAIGVLK